MAQPVSSVAGDAQGVVAVEFALIAPILGVALVAAVDLGFAIQERMAMDHAVRAAAQYAMSDPSPGDLHQALTLMAAPNFTLGGGAYDLVAQIPVRYCACPTAPSTAIVCSTTCNGWPNSIFYRLTVQKTYDSKSFIVPKIAMSSTALVQIR